MQGASPTFTTGLKSSRSREEYEYESVIYPSDWRWGNEPTLHTPGNLNMTAQSNEVSKPTTSVTRTYDIGGRSAPLTPILASEVRMEKTYPSVSGDQRGSRLS